ncbi:flippase [Thalassospira sp. MCCC 1A03138]|uniref:flippase n=1 Tax=Thalassospira sp. MCCC 1A03138 TaxID=1470576 RepID=UPI000A1E0F4D|nr:flippase [Thalassospira sp. MCCC 1A03138]
MSGFMKSFSVLKKTGLYSFMSNTSWIVFESIIRAIVGLTVGVFIARYLGPENLGKLSYSSAIVGMFGVLAGLGMDSNIVRDLVKEKDRVGEKIGITFFLKLSGSLIAVICCISSVFILRPNDETVVSITIILSMSMFFLPFDVVSLYFQSIVKSKYAVLAKSFSCVLSAILRIILIFNDSPLISFAWVGLAEAILSAVALTYFFLLKRNKVGFSWSYKFETAKKILAEGWPLLLSAAGAALYMRVDLVMLGQLSSNRSVGIYTAALRISEIWYFLPAAFISSLQPFLVRAREISRDLYIFRLRVLYEFMILLSFIVSIFIFLFADYLVQIIYGHQYQETALVLRTHTWATMAVFLGVASSQYLVIENLQRISFYRTAIGLVVNLVMNALFIPIWGAFGAAFATVISFYISAFSLILFDSSRGQCFIISRSILPLNLINFIRGAKNYANF